MRTVHGAAGIKALVGEDLGWSHSEVITQERVNQFAVATGDHQWIHVDPERAARESPFGGPIAHGYLTLALVTYFLPRMWDVTGFTMGVNYGCEKVRFPSPVPVGAEVRCNVHVDAAEDIPGGVQVTLTATIQCEGTPKPSCVAAVVYRYYE